MSSATRVIGHSPSRGSMSLRYFRRLMSSRRQVSTIERVHDLYALNWDLELRQRVGRGVLTAPTPGGLGTARPTLLLMERPTKSGVPNAGLQESKVVLWFGIDFSASF